MVIKVGINGFGRVGRVVFRTCLQSSDLEVSAINDPAVDVEYITYLIKFDSTHGKFKGGVTYSDNEIKVNDKGIKVFHQKTPTSIPWHTAGVQYVIEASGMFTNLEKASGHLASDSVKRIIVTAPSVDVPMVILGVNENKVNIGQKVISCGSSTLYCLAPIVKVLEDHYGLEDGFITSIHAMTPSLKPLDGLCLRGKHWRDHRSIHQNIIPATTGACKALGKIIPSVRDKMTGLAFRVPIVNVSVLDLTVRLSKETTLQDIINTVDKESRSFMQNILKISKEQAVSSDFAGDSYSCILDADSSLELNPTYYKLICWYENEYSYACRVIDSIYFSEKQLCRSELKCKMTYVRPRPSKKQDVVQQTDCCIRESSLDRAYAFNPKIISSNTSQSLSFKNKQCPRSMILRKPLTQNGCTSPSGSIRSPKKRTEIFKIWNDENEPPKPGRQNPNSFFQSCITFTPQESGHSDCMKAQERLEKVKQEFSKMVNITEDLLRKSYSNKLSFNGSESSKDELAKTNVALKRTAKEANKNYYERAIETCKNLQTSNVMFDVGGGGKTSVSTINSKLVKDVDSVISYEKDNSEYNIPITETKFSLKPESLNTIKPYKQELPTKVTIVDNANSFNPIKPCKQELSAKVTMVDNGISAISTANTQSGDNRKFDEAEQQPNVNNFKEQVTKTINTIIDGFSKNFQYQSYSHDGRYQGSSLDEKIYNKKFHCTSRAPIAKRIKTFNYDEELKKLQVLKAENDIFKVTYDKFIKDEEHEKEILSKMTKNSFKNIININLIDEELKKRNIVLVSDQTDSVHIKPQGDFITEEFKDAIPDHYSGIKLSNGDCKMEDKSVLKPECSQEDNKKGIKEFHNTNKESYSQLKDINDEPNKSIIMTEKIATKVEEINLETDSFRVSSNDKQENCSFKDVNLDIIEFRDICRKPSIHKDDNRVTDIETDDITDRQENKCNIENIEFENFIVKSENFRRESILQDDYFKVNSSKMNTKEYSENSKPDPIVNDDSYKNESQKESRLIDEIDSTKVHVEKDNDQTESHVFESVDLSAEIDEDFKDLDLRSTKNMNVTVPKIVNFSENTNFFESQPPNPRYSNNNNITSETNKIKQDIYDKLDSASVTDSDSSFHIDGRKSQVINITDLTNSLEDLVRLDKICRIIEISDELSDKLFSSLDKAEESSTNRTKKKWSFKDLCEKINLDEFCNKVFGKSTI